MKLYHGTSGRLLDRILKTGLEPRGRRKGNWKHTADSHPNCVYFSNAYAPYFAIQAAATSRKALVVEIDTDKLDESDLLPDEDFLAQALAKTDGVPGTLATRCVHYRDNILTYMDGSVWRTSLDCLGTCSHWGRVPRSAITRAVLFDLDKNRNMRFVFDPTITLMNYNLLGEDYRAKMAYMFDGVLPPGMSSGLGRNNTFDLTGTMITIGRDGKPHKNPMVRKLAIERRGLFMGSSLEPVGDL